MSQVKKNEARFRKLADHLVRVGRHYIAAVTAPNRAENQQAEQEFEDALLDLFVWIESFPTDR